MRWAVQWARVDVLGNKQTWKQLGYYGSREVAVMQLRAWRTHERALRRQSDWPRLQRAYRLVRLVPKSEKLRMAIVKELRAVAEEHSLYVSEDDEKWAHSSQTLEAMADRIERGEVG